MDPSEIFRRRFEREREARKQAEKIIEEKSRELYIKNIELERLAESERKARLEVERLSLIDYLTGLANRRQFDEAGRAEFSRSARHGHALAAIMLDLDHFKRVNDTYGHAAGDAVLAAAAGICRRLLRVSDIAARIGGEEFCLLLPETDARGAAVLAERLRASIAGLAFGAKASPLKVTASFGISERAGDGDSFEALIGRSDKALYRAKTNGRNRIGRS
jgi:diguanylate cyclase (GGDEF)-like protein